MMAKLAMMAMAALSHKTPISTITARSTQKMKIVQRLESRKP